MPKMDMGKLRAATANAFAKWKEVTDFTFQEAENAADIKIGFNNAGDHVDGMHGVLAHATKPTGGIFHFDDDERWAFNPLFVDFFDVETVAVHEIGHVLGLEHSEDPKAMMYPNAIKTGMRRVDLGENDILGIRVLYQPLG